MWSTKCVSYGNTCVMGRTRFWLQKHIHHRGPLGAHVRTRVLRPTRTHIHMHTDKIEYEIEYVFGRGSASERSWSFGFRILMISLPGLHVLGQRKQVFRGRTEWRKHREAEVSHTQRWRETIWVPCFPVLCFTLVWSPALLCVNVTNNLPSLVGLSWVAGTGQPADIVFPCEEERRQRKGLHFVCGTRHKAQGTKHGGDLLTAQQSMVASDRARCSDSGQGFLHPLLRRVRASWESQCLGISLLIPCPYYSFRDALKFNSVTLGDWEITNWEWAGGGVIRRWHLWQYVQKLLFIIVAYRDPLLPSTGVICNEGIFETFPLGSFLHPLMWQRKRTALIWAVFNCRLLKPGSQDTIGQCGKRHVNIRRRLVRKDARGECWPIILALPWVARCFMPWIYHEWRPLCICCSSPEGSFIPLQYVYLGSS